MPKVLVVEDNPLASRFFREALAAFDIESLMAADAREALALAAHIRCDLLLIDAHLPDSPGQDVLAAIRHGDGPSRNTPAIATTAAHGDVVESLLSAGFEAVIHKPVRIEALRAALAPYIETPAQDCLLDETLARSVAGGDQAIVSALRGLFAGELDALPGELTGFALRRDRDGMRERLHRLAASAGFCGAHALAAAVTELHRALDDADTELDAALVEFLARCRATRAALASLNVENPPAPRH